MLVKRHPWGTLDGGSQRYCQAIRSSQFGSVEVVKVETTVAIPLVAAPCPSAFVLFASASVLAACLRASSQLREHEQQRQRQQKNESAPPTSVLVSVAVKVAVAPAVVAVGATRMHSPPINTERFEYEHICRDLTRWRTTLVKRALVGNS